MEGISVSNHSQSNSVWHRFTQQRLRAWQPILSPKWVISLYLLFGAMFLIVGLVLTNGASKVVDIVENYTEKDPDANGIVTFDIDIPRDMAPPIWVAYHLEGFHQNHRQYLKSRSDLQLKVGTTDQDVKDPNKKLVDCKPWIFQGAPGLPDLPNRRPNYPCGLVARSVFNDRFAFAIKAPQQDKWSSLSVDESAANIAWKADYDGRFNNLNPEGRRVADEDPYQVSMNMWLLGQFPPVRCEQQMTPNNDVAWIPAKVKMKNITRISDPKQAVQVPDCTGYMPPATPTCNFTLSGLDFDCTGNYKLVNDKDWGTESGHLMVWMRVAGLPSFRKLWGRINTELKAGSTLKVYIESRFVVKQFAGTKSLCLTTSSLLGGRSIFLGISYLVMAGACLVFAMIFTWRLWFKPRPLGDVRLLAQYWQ